MFAKAALASAVAVLVTALSLASSPPGEAHSHQASLQGTWKCISESSEGELTPEECFQTQKIIIEGRSIHLHMTQEVVKGTFVLSKEGMDITFVWSALGTIEEEKPEVRRLVKRVLYRIEGDRLTICINKLDDSRPTDLTPGPGKIVLVYKRDNR
jgi:uncharacterized protein (TIGR03067 family)